ncbi:hypothetical protein BRC61_06960 [Halobacteriales archaeon QH_10_65_19]|nr:MAG: hypothetical protein BRC61_06960 [Halobacteriales archaeon QH_10_65_19]
MVNLTLLEVHLEDGSFSANLPFSGVTDTDDGDDAVPDDEDSGATVADEESGGPGKGAAVLGVLLLLVLGAALVKYLSGGDEESDVAIETADEGPVGVSVDTGDE